MTKPSTLVHVVLVLILLSSIEPMRAAVTALQIAATTNLPQGIKRIAFGQVQRTGTPTTGLQCTIPSVLPEPPTFAAGVTEVSYIIEVDPMLVPALKASIVGSFGSSEIRGLGCDRVGVCAGQLCQSQYGMSYSRTDGAPIASGSFVLEVQVGSDTIKVPFAVK